MKPGNYCTHAINDLSATLNSHIMNGTLSKESRAFVADVIKYLQQSIKFVLPENGKFYDMIETKSLVSGAASFGNTTGRFAVLQDHEAESWAPPYKLTAYEYTINMLSQELNPGELKSSKRILLTVDFEDSTFILLVIWFDSMRSWSPVFGCLQVHKPIVVEDGCIADGVMDVLLPSSEQGESEVVKAIVPEMAALIQAFIFMRCNNVYVKTLPTPIRLNKSRRKKGKPPLFEYKVLEVKESKGIIYESEPGSMKRTSPRIHLRRGHIRTFQNGDSTYVSPCVVGNKKQGMIHKDYAAQSSVTLAH